jgi:hypothetical protein
VQEKDLETKQDYELNFQEFLLPENCIADDLNNETYKFIKSNISLNFFLKKLGCNDFRFFNAFGKILFVTDAGQIKSIRVSSVGYAVYVDASKKKWNGVIFNKQDYSKTRIERKGVKILVLEN